MATEDVNKTDDTDTDKIQNCLTQMIDLLESERLNVGELILLLSNLQYLVGASIEGHVNGKGPGLEELKKLYLTNPTVGVNMMLAGMTMSTWYDTYMEHVKNIKEKEDK